MIREYLEKFAHSMPFLPVKKGKSLIPIPIPIPFSIPIRRPLPQIESTSPVTVPSFLLQSFSHHCQRAIHEHEQERRARKMEKTSDGARPAKARLVHSGGKRWDYHPQAAEANFCSLHSSMLFPLPA